MSKILNILMVLVISLVSGLSFLTNSCKTNSGAIVTQPVKPQATTSQAIVPYIPPAYYGSMAVPIDDLLRNYFGRAGNLLIAEQTYNGLPFVFNGVRVVASMLIDDSTFYYSNAQFIAMQPGAVGKLKAGDLIDIVGINGGPMPEAEGKPLASWFNDDGSLVLTVSLAPGWLYFTDCIFLPAGSVQLPAPGGSAFAPLY